MPRAGTRPPAKETLLAIAASLDAGVSVTETLRAIARAGPTSAQAARRIAEALGTGTLADALAAEKLLDTAGRAVVALGEELGRLPAALRWAAERAHTAGTRRAAMLGAALGPLFFAAIALLLEPLPQLVLGQPVRWWPIVRPLVILMTLIGGAVWVVPHYYARVRSVLRRVPWLGGLIALDEEARVASLLATFGGPDAPGATPRVLRALGFAAAAGPASDELPPLSEAFALVVHAGVAARDLPARSAALAVERERAVTLGLRRLARTLAFVVLAAVAIAGVQKLVTAPLPGLPGMGLDLGNLGGLGGPTSPEMRELEKELENAH